MKTLLLLIFSLAIAGSLGIQWKKIYEVNASFSDYCRSAQHLIYLTEQSMLNNRMEMAAFIDQLSDNYVLTTFQLNETECYTSFFNLTRIQRSFQSEIFRSQIPIENLLLEIRGKLDDINATIHLSQNLADSKYSICKVFNATKGCEETTELWLEGFLTSVKCLIAPESCSSHVLSKRSVASYCSTKEFACGSGECISPYLICNSRSDCSDGSDEDKCYNGDFFCKNGISRTSIENVCNGREDCNDGSDELYCGKVVMSNCIIEYGMHRCDSDKCIGVDQVCDGNRDCVDGTDEGPLCGMGTCPEECVKQGGVCFHGPRGPLCFAKCPLGTFESQLGCTARAHSTKRTLVELLKEIPKLTQRRNKNFIEIKMTAAAFVSKAMSDVFKCLDPYYTILAKAIRYPSNNQTAVKTDVTESHSTVPEVTTESDY